MVDFDIVNQIRNDPIVMENLREMKMDQEPKDRGNYVEVATEAIASPETQGNIANSLYRELQKASAIDFGKIPDSKGDLSKYVYYDVMYDCIKLINQLTEGAPTPNIETMNKLHKILLLAAPDFQFGFRTNNDMLIKIYNVQVRALHELIDIGVVDATNYLRKCIGAKESNSAGTVRSCTAAVNQFIKAFENGQWAILMKNIKSSGSSTTNGPSLKDFLASESAMLTADETDIYSSLVAAEGIVEIAKTVGSTAGYVASAASLGFKEASQNAANSDNPKDKKVALPIKILGAIVAVIAILAGIRKLVYLFFEKSNDLKEKLRNNATVLKKAMAIQNSNASGIEKQKKLCDALDGVSDTIEYKVLKAEKNASTEISKSNKEEFNPKEINKIDGSDFSL